MDVSAQHLPRFEAFERGVSGRRHRPVLQRILPARTPRKSGLLIVAAVTESRCSTIRQSQEMD